MAKSNVTLRRTQSVVDQLEQMRDRIRRRAYDLFRSNGSSSPNPLEDWLNAEREMVWQPPVELRQKDGHFEVVAAVAGIDPKNLDVQVTPDDLVIRGNSVHEHASDTETVHLCEFSQGQLFRSVRFPRRVDPAKVTADYRNGMLRITAPIDKTVHGHSEVGAKP